MKTINTAYRSNTNMSFVDKKISQEQPSDPNWTAPEINEWTPELLKDLERLFGKRGCWPVSIEYRQWIENKFDEQFKNINYKAQYFDQDEFDRIRKRRGLI